MQISSNFNEISITEVPNNAFFYFDDVNSQLEFPIVENITFWESLLRMKKTLGN